MARRLHYTETPQYHEQAFRAMERVLAARERPRLIRKGTIRPPSMMQPQLLLKVDGKWVPEVKTYN